MKKNNLLITFSALASLMGGFSAFASGVEVPAELATSPAITTPALTWAQFQESCLHPEQFNNQAPPSGITIQCTHVSKEFVPDQPGQVALSASNVVVSSVISDKYHVSAQSEEVPMADTAGNCMRYREVEKVITKEVKLTCENVAGIESTLGEYCASVGNDAKAANPRMVETKATGRVIDTCGGAQTLSLGDGEPLI
jgi:hypothetical protein